MDQVTKIMHIVSKMEKERLRNIIILSALLLSFLFCVIFYCAFVLVQTVSEFGFGDLVIVFTEDPKEFFSIIGENFSLFSEFFETEMIIALILSLIFIVIFLVKSDLPSFPKRFRETKKY